MRYRSLEAWLEWLEGLHPEKIDLSLERIQEVADRLNLRSLEFPIITVGGTNGKGSTVALLQSMLAAADYRVGCFTSPHLERYNERIAIAGVDAPDADIMRAFVAIDDARGTVSLSYFEFNALAAVWLFREKSVDIAVLEVGLGGRLDAVNIWDADVAVLTSIGVDHTQWLGDTRESISLEKAAIARPRRVLVCGDPEPPTAMMSYLNEIGSDCWLLNRDFSFMRSVDGWSFQAGSKRIGALPAPAQKGEHQFQNAATAIAALLYLAPHIQVTEQSIRQGLERFSIAGRYEELIRDGMTVILDVAHNPHGGVRLARTLNNDRDQYERTIVIIGMMEDKQAGEFMRVLADQVDVWVLCQPDYYRAMSVTALEAELMEAQPSGTWIVADSVYDAYQKALDLARPADRLLVTGSFYTVAELRQKLL